MGEQGLLYLTNIVWHHSVTVKQFCLINNIHVYNLMICVNKEHLTICVGFLSWFCNIQLFSGYNIVTQPALNEKLRKWSLKLCFFWLMVPHFLLKFCVLQRELSTGCLIYIVLKGISNSTVCVLLDKVWMQFLKIMALIASKN